VLRALAELLPETGIQKKAGYYHLNAAGLHSIPEEYMEAKELCLYNCDLDKLCLKGTGFLSVVIEGKVSSLTLCDNPKLEALSGDVNTGEDIYVKNNPALKRVSGNWYAGKNIAVENTVDTQPVSLEGVWWPGKKLSVYEYTLTSLMDIAWELGSTPPEVALQGCKLADKAQDQLNDIRKTGVKVVYTEG